MIVREKSFRKQQSHKCRAEQKTLNQHKKLSAVYEDDKWTHTHASYLQPRFSTLLIDLFEQLAKLLKEENLIICFDI